MLHTEFAHLALEALLKIDWKIGTVRCSQRPSDGAYKHIFHVHMKKVSPARNVGLKCMFSRYVNENSHFTAYCAES
jgi:hypothetical protein